MQTGLNRTSFADIELSLDWRSAVAWHRERLFVSRASLWRDLFPADLAERLHAAPNGEPVRAEFRAGELVPAYDSAEVRRIARSVFRRRAGGLAVEPRVGRFYPRAFAAEALGSFATDHRPMRVLERHDDALLVDLNHPLARYPLELSARVIERLPTREERGGSANDIAELVTRGGPGMEAPEGTAPTDFFSGAPFARADETDDAHFYREPRLVQHIDSAAEAQVAAIYARALPRRARVLDLMSSCFSHLPAARDDLSVTGLGMNAQELEQNPMLAHGVLHDLNADPRLPFADGAFDAVICTVSFEYLTRPLAVLADVARVLAPGGTLVIVLSERWFPPKAIALWTELHPFERLGFALECLRRTSAFTDLATESVRGLPRPADDKYGSTLAFSDPIYAVWGTRA